MPACVTWNTSPTRDPRSLDPREKFSGRLTHSAPRNHLATTAQGAQPPAAFQVRGTLASRNDPGPAKTLSRIEPNSPAFLTRGRRHVRLTKRPRTRQDAFTCRTELPASRPTRGGGWRFTHSTLRDLIVNDARGARTPGPLPLRSHARVMNDAGPAKTLLHPFNVSTRHPRPLDPREELTERLTHFAPQDEIRIATREPSLQPLSTRVARSAHERPRAPPRRFHVSNRTPRILDPPDEGPWAPHSLRAPGRNSDRCPRSPDSSRLPRAWHARLTKRPRAHQDAFTCRTELPASLTRRTRVAGHLTHSPPHDKFGSLPQEPRLHPPPARVARSAHETTPGPPKRFHVSNRTPRILDPPEELAGHLTHSPPHDKFGSLHEEPRLQPHSTRVARSAHETPPGPPRRFHVSNRTPRILDPPEELAGHLTHSPPHDKFGSLHEEPGFRPRSTRAAHSAHETTPGPPRRSSAHSRVELPAFLTHRRRSLSASLTPRPTTNSDRCPGAQPPAFHLRPTLGSRQPRAPQYAFTCRPDVPRLLDPGEEAGGRLPHSHSPPRDEVANAA